MSESSQAAALAAEIASLKAQLHERDSQIAGLTATVARLNEQIAALSERIRELGRMLGKNSGNSGKPPSSDGLAKPNAKPKAKSGSGSRRPGGQPGHRGSALKRSAAPDHVVNHYPDKCRGCGLRTAAEYPAGVRAPVQHGPRIGSLILYLSAAQLIPVKRLREALLHLHGVSLSQGTVHSVLRRAAERHAGFWRHLRSELAAAPVKHFDETGMRVGGRLRWFHVACTGLLCQFRLGGSRGDIMAEAAGIAVHDHWKPYFSMPDAEHAVCSAHLLRELQALVDHDDEVWAENMRDHLLEAIGAAKGGSPPARRTAEIENHYDLLAGDGIRHHEALPALRSKRKGRPRRRPGHNLAIRLRDFKAETLRFLRDPAVPPTNNMAERDLRLLKVKQKISGSFRTEAGARDFAVLRSLAGTARKQGWDIIPALRTDPEILTAMLRTGGPLPQT